MFGTGLIKKTLKKIKMILHLNFHPGALIQLKHMKLNDAQFLLWQLNFKIHFGIKGVEHFDYCVEPGVCEVIL